MILLVILAQLTWADIQSDFFQRMESSGQGKKTVEPAKVKVAITMVTKKIGAEVEETQVVPGNPFALSIDPQKYVSYIHQLIYFKFKNKTLCRAQIETYQQQSLYNGMKVLCLDESGKTQTFQETL